MDMINEIHNFRNKLTQHSIYGDLKSYVAGCALKESDTYRAPISINLDLTVACNYRCSHCIDKAIINTGLYFDFKTVTHTLTTLSLHGLRSVILIGGGEPTLYPRVAEVIKLIKLLGMQCAVVSNGSHNEIIAEAAKYLTLGDWVRISLDAASEKTFQTLHQPRIPITLKEVCRSAERIKQANPKVQLGCSFIVIPCTNGKADSPLVTNVEEMPLAAELARKNRFDYISFKPFLVRNSEGGESIFQPEDQVDDKQPHNDTRAQVLRSFARATACATNNFQVIASIDFKEFLSHNPFKFNELKPQPRHCHMQRFRQVLTPHGIYGCPAFRGDIRSFISSPQAYNSPAAFQETQALVWKQIEEFNPSIVCRNVNCIYNSTNLWIASLIGKPLFVNSVKHLKEAKNTFL